MNKRVNWWFLVGGLGTMVVGGAALYLDSAIRNSPDFPIGGSYDLLREAVSFPHFVVLTWLTIACGLLTLLVTEFGRNSRSWRHWVAIPGTPVGIVGVAATMLAAVAFLVAFAVGFCLVLGSLYLMAKIALGEL